MLRQETWLTWKLRSVCWRRAHELRQRAAQAEVVDIALRAVSWEAEVSLEAALPLAEALARDLQADFLPHVPRAMSALADVLDEGAHARLPWSGSHGYGGRAPPSCPDPGPGVKVEARRPPVLTRAS